MDIIIPLLIVSVLIGIPTWLIVHIVNKADKSTIIYSPEEVTRRLRKGFYLSFWGMDLLFGAIPSFVLILCDLPTVFQFIVPAVAFVVGFIMFFIGIEISYACVRLSIPSLIAINRICFSGNTRSKYFPASR